LRELVLAAMPLPEAAEQSLTRVPAAAGAVRAPRGRAAV